MPCQFHQRHFTNNPTLAVVPVCLGICHFIFVFELTDVQCDQIGRILEVLGDKFSYKSSPNIW